MNKLLIFTINLLLCILFGNSIAQVRTNIDENWKFSLGNAADPTKDFNFGIANIYSKTSKADFTAIEAKFNDSLWKTVQIPHDWAVELPFEYSMNVDVLGHGYKPIGGLFPQNSIGWYRKSFNITKADSGQRFSLQFDGIFRDSRIWVNGFYLGNHQSGYLGVEYDVTDYINFTKPNVIVVRVDATQFEGWYYEGAGIYRHVWLNKFNNTHFDRTNHFITTTIIEKTSTINIKSQIYNQATKPLSFTSFSYLIDNKGKKIAQTAEIHQSIGKGARNSFSQQIQLSNLNLWSIENPYLYKVVSILKLGNTIVDSIKTNIGIRNIEINENGLFLNGKYTKIYGVNCHQDHAGLGIALPDGMQYYRIKLLKEMGVNAYRTSHHAPTPQLLDACDSLGMLVIDEHRLLNSSPEYISQLENLIKRDRNHPSVFLWSIGNEEGYVQTNSFGKRIAQTLIDKQYELDSTRTCTYAADLANQFAGINEVIPVRGFNYRQFAVEEYHKSHPKQPIVGTEMGSTVSTRGVYEVNTTLGYVPDQDITAPWWASTSETWWQLCAQQKNWMGGFIWTGFDYRGEPTPYEWPNINSHFGVMDMCGFPKNIYYYYQSWWTNKDILHISPHWNWKGSEGKSIKVWVNSNAQNVELFLNKKSLGKKMMPINGHLNWDVAYEPGKLEAVAFKDGRKIVSQMETTDEPYLIKISPSTTKIKANGTDICVSNISVVDKKGREIPTASNLIDFNLNGNMKIIGVGNGDPSSHEADICSNGKWQRNLFNGKCQVIIQSQKVPGIYTFEAKADGLKKASLQLKIE